MGKLTVGVYAVIILVMIVAMEYGIFQRVYTHQLSVEESVSETFVVISAIEAKQLIDINSRKLTILDVRSVDEYEKEHIKGAIDIPLQWLQDGGVDQLNKDNAILVYSKSGIRSVQAGQFLINNGFSRVYIIEGGIFAWKNEGFTTVIKSGGCGCR